MPKLSQNILTSQLYDIIVNREEKIIVLEGSSRSTKTYSVCQRMIIKAIENEGEKKPVDRRSAIIRARLSWLKKSVLIDFEHILKTQFGMWDERLYNRQDSTYRFGHTLFEFGGLDYEGGQKFHGVAYDDAWFNEAVEFDYPSVRQILLRLKGQAYFDYNPNMDERHWIETKIKARDDAIVIHSTYKDNPFLEDSVVEEIERLEPNERNIEQGTADVTAWKIYGLGVQAMITGLVFPNIRIVDKIPGEAENICYGMDFGFTNDPTTLVKKAKYNNQLYFDEKLYERGLTNIDNPRNPKQRSIEARLGELQINPKSTIWADSAEPKSIEEIKGCGYNVKGIKKGTGSILDGINTMKRFIINVTESSMNLIREFRTYKWLESRDGVAVNKPIDAWNHIIDAARYSVHATEAKGGLEPKPQYDSTKMNLGLEKYG